MGIRQKAKTFAHRLWIRAVTYCEAKDKILELQQRVRLAHEAVEDTRQQSEQKITKARQQSQYDIECANKDATEAERAFKEKQNDLELLKVRIDAEAVPVATDMIARAKKETADAIHQAKKMKNIAASYIGKIQKRIEFYENTDFDLTFEEVQDLRKTLEYEYYNTERKLDAINKVVSNWEVPQKLRNRIEDDRQFLQSLNDEAHWIIQP